jgi:hypothetical protein
MSNLRVWDADRSIKHLKADGNGLNNDPHKLVVNASGVIGSSPSANIGCFCAVPVLSDWTLAANAAADIKTATGIIYPNGFPDDAYVEICLWEGPAVIQDFAMLMVRNGTMFSYYNSYTTNSTLFSSPPTSGTAYILGIEYFYNRTGFPS